MLSRDFSSATCRVTGYALALSTVLLAACSSVKLNNMVPASFSTVTAHHAKSIRIGAITGNQKEVFGGAELINAEEFKAVLTETFSRSRLFTTVTDSAADLEITAKFLAHGQVPRGLTAEQAMVVEYALTDLHTGREIWKQAINSRHTVTVGEVWGGAKRTRTAQEGCVRKNMEQLVVALNSLSPSTLQP